MANEKEKRTAPKFGARKSSETGDVIATLITGTIARTKPQSIAEGLLI